MCVYVWGGGGKGGTGTIERLGVELRNGCWEWKVTKMVGKLEVGLKYGFYGQMGGGGGEREKGHGENK